jgi:hypothetical protein
MFLRLFLRPDPAAFADGGRDLRIDLARGLALIFIFLNHIPDNIASWVSNRNWGFSDATEIFVFVSGYSAMLAYGSITRRSGFARAAASVLRRAWQIYLAHLVLFIFFVAQIAYVSANFDNPMFAEEMNVGPLLERPDVILLQAVLLRFKPVNMDVLPLYIVLLVVFPVVLWAMLRAPLATLLSSILLYVAARRLGWNLSAYPEGGWFFNPFAWQILFVLGAYCAATRTHGFWRRLQPGIFGWLAAGYLVFAFAIVLTWHHPPLTAWVPAWLNAWMYPIDKTNLDILRLLHFLAGAYLAVQFVPLGAKWLQNRWLAPVILCGRQSLHVFCVGVFLSFGAHFFLTVMGSGAIAELLVSAVGVLLMIAVAGLADWYKQAEKGSAPVTAIRGIAE